MQKMCVISAMITKTQVQFEIDMLMVLQKQPDNIQIGPQEIMIIDCWRQKCSNVIRRHFILNTNVSECTIFCGDLGRADRGFNSRLLITKGLIGRDS